MKDTAISYDLVHNQQQDQQHHSWNQHRPITHTTSVYTNHHAGQQHGSSRAQLVGANNPSGAGGHHHHHHNHHHQHQQNALNQYQHQHLQSNQHSVAAAAYYQQAHLYSHYQGPHAHSQDQQSTTEHQSHHAGPTAPVSETAIVPQHNVGHHTPVANTQASALNHNCWPSSGVGNIGPQTHHAVVSDHSSLAYMTHPYQSHTTSVTDHRGSGNSMSNQTIGNTPQANSYVDNLYNTPAAAAVAAYGYNGYNAAFFQASNNNPHAQTGHPPSATLSAFWNHNQNAQQRSSHTQAVSNQASIQQRQQQLPPEQATNYLHDPRLYYGRHTYGQNVQNFGQQQNSPSHGSDFIHNRVPGIAHQTQSVLSHEQLPHQTDAQHTQNHSSSESHHQPQANQNSYSFQHQTQPTDDTPSFHTNPSTILNHGITKSQPIGVALPQKAPTSNELERTPSSTKSHIKFEPAVNKQLTSQNAYRSTQSSADKESGASISPQTVGKDIPQAKSISVATKSQAVIKSDPSLQYQPKKSNNGNLPQSHNRSPFCVPDSDKIEMTKKILANEKEIKPLRSESKDHTSSQTRQKESMDEQCLLDESMASLTLNARKTTWASIASQPAKVSQPKSLKSKIAGSSSVLSSSKHLSPASIDSSNLDSKNGINPAIKSSVSAAATTIQRASVPPPISKITAAAASLKLDLLGDELADSTKISWPAVNASATLAMSSNPTPKEGHATSGNSYNSDVPDKNTKDNASKDHDRREMTFRDHNHNQGPGSKLGDSFNSHRDRRDEYWPRHRDQRDFRPRNPISDRREINHDKKIESREEHNYSPREFRAGGRQFRDDAFKETRELKRNMIMDGGDFRERDTSFKNSRYPPGHYEGRNRDRREVPSLNNSMLQNRSRERHQESGNTAHHHYNNVRDGNMSRDTHMKPDLNLHPHLDPANFNPKEFNCEPENARYFIIKSYSEDDIHRSIKYAIWCSTNHGNKRLDEAYRQQQSKNGPMYLFYSVNGSGHFCGMAEMVSFVDFDASSGVWAQSKWQGKFSVKWIFVKDVPNGALRHITLENNENKPVTNSRDTQEVPSEKGKAVLKIIHQYQHTTSIFDDFLHYERRQEEEKMKKSHPEERERVNGPQGNGGARFNGRPYVNPRPPHGDLQSGIRDRSTRFAA